MPIAKKSDPKKVLSPSPGQYAGALPEQVIFDKSVRLAVDRNHWKVATGVAAAIALAAILTRQAPPPVVRAYGVSADAAGKPVVRELQAYQPQSRDIQVGVKDLVTRWFTIEPVLTARLTDSRLSRNIESVKDQMSEAAKTQFQDWLAADAPFRSITSNPSLIREVQVTAVALLPDNTVSVDFTTITTEDVQGKPRRQRYALVLRYQVTPPDTEVAVMGPNPFGIHPVFFSLQKSAV